MRRRDFIAGLGGAAAWPIATRAQPVKRPTIGFLGNSALSSAPLVSEFVGRLRELGWVEGRNISIEYRWIDGNPERVAEIAAEFVRLNVDVIHTTGNEMSLAVKGTTSVIP